MAARITTVAMTQDERSRLELIVPGARPPTRLHDWLPQWLMTGAVATCVLLALTAVTTLIVRDWSGMAGWGADYLPFAILACPLLAAAYASACTWIFARESRENLRRAFEPYRIDAQAALVREERYVLLDCRAVHEPEEGGRIYLLRTQDSRCLVVFDIESFDLAERGGDPARSLLRPAREAVVRWAPASDMLLKLEFHGEAFPHGPAEHLDYPLPYWTDNGKLWKSDWDEVERRLSQSRGNRPAA